MNYCVLTFGDIINLYTENMIRYNYLSMLMYTNYQYTNLALVVDFNVENVSEINTSNGIINDIYIILQGDGLKGSISFQVKHYS